MASLISHQSACLLSHMVHCGFAQDIIDAQHTERALMQFVDNAGADHPAQMHMLIRAFVVFIQNQWLL